MIRVYALVEGETERTFIEEVLIPHLQDLGVYLTPVLVMTKRASDGRKFKGGVSRYAAVRKDLRNLLADRSVVAVTTMIDYYGVPEDFPGRASLPRAGSCYNRVAHLEASFRADLDDPRFRPYLSLHEFEALLLTAPETIATVLPEEAFAHRLVEEAAGFRSPEEIDDGPETHPAARIARLAPRYRKTLHGPLAIERIGLSAIRRSCPHFNEWVTWLEGLRPA